MLCKMHGREGSHSTLVAQGSPEWGVRLFAQEKNMQLLIAGGMLTIAVSASLAPANAGGGIMPTVHEEECDGWARGLRGWAIC
jgi:hypothetical protein